MDDHYSLIIIGGGITGLSAAITWMLNAENDKRSVLILEKQPIVGGMVTSFKRKGYLFDTGQMIPDICDLLDYLGINIKLKKFEHTYMRLILVDKNSFSFKRIEIPAGSLEFEKMLKKRYPNQEKEISKFMENSRKMFAELFNLKVEMNFFQLLKTLFTCPNIVKNANRTFSEYYKKFNINDPELIEILDAFAAFSALPTNRVAAILTIAAMNTTLNGAYRPEKGFIEFPLKLSKRVIELGGKIRTKSKVEKILIEDGKAIGVRLITGETFYGDKIITTIDPKIAMKELAGLDIIRNLDPEYTDKVEKVKMSTSAITISLGLDEKIDLSKYQIDGGYNVITTGKGTFEKLFQHHDKGHLYYSEDCFHLAVIAPSLITGFKPALSIRVVPVPMEDWMELYKNNHDVYNEKKERVAEFYITQVEKYIIPNLREHIIVKDIATPATFARFSGSPTGSNYDMAPYPDNFGRKRLRMRTPVKNLYQPKFSHGIWPSMQAGLQVVDMILNGKIMNGNSRYMKK